MEIALHAQAQWLTVVHQAVALLRKQDPSKLEAIQEKLLQQVPDRGEATK